jgi:GNAT superfamily N-acetyltransferase
MHAAPTAAQPETDRALASRLEAMHGWCISQYALSLQRLRPAVGAAVLPIAGGIAIYTGPSPFSFTVGIGITGSVTVEQVDAIEEFFRSRNHSVRIDVTPFTDPGMLDLLRSRNYRPSEFTSVLVLDLGLCGDRAVPRPVATSGLSSTTSALPGFARPGAIATLPDKTTIRWAALEECNVWIDVVAHCFFVADPGLDRRANMAALFHVPGSLNTFATVNDELVGVASGMIHPDGDIVALFGSATLPQFRRRGIHRAMLDFRLSHARLQGCKLALITATPGSTSERNLVRHGFVSCYEKVTYAK